ncbi:MAG: radical SAM protein [Candidatus Omnitrophota bacterium]
MMPRTAKFNDIVKKLKDAYADVDIDKFNIKITGDLTKTSFDKISPPLYLILNKFENSHRILIDGIPYCLMPDAADHLMYNKSSTRKYLKDDCCHKCKHDGICPGWIKKSAVKIRPEAIKDLPREIVFEVTAKCNLNCPLCFNAKNSKDLSLRRIKTLIDECARLGIKRVRFTGGEPLLYSKFQEALAYAKSKKLYIIVNTNATMINKENERLLRTQADDLLISLQGYNSITEKELTRSSTGFKEKINTVARLNSRIAHVRLGTIISRNLVEHFEKYFYLIQSLGVKHWALFRPMSQDNSGNFDIAVKDYLKLMKRIRLKRLQGHDISIANPLPFCISKDMDLSHHVLSGGESDDGHSRLVVDVDGFIKPSYFIRQNLGAKIKEAWENEFAQKIRSLNYLPAKCQNCFSLRWCKGGSRHWAKISYNDFFKPDPLMNVEKNLSTGNANINSCCARRVTHAGNARGFEPA